MQKAKRVIAMIGVIILVLLYVLTLVLAIVDKSSSMNFFMASIIATLVIPVLIWTISFFMERNRKDFYDEVKYSSLRENDSEKENN